MHKVQFKVKPVTRYIVTEYTQHEDNINGKISGFTNSAVCGEFANVGLANQACDALAHNYIAPIEVEDVEIQYKLFSHDYDQDELSWITVENPRYYKNIVQD